MPERSRSLPPVQALVVFEAAARHLNFSAAARALGTTQPAVSHRIGHLEADLGAPLFRRLRRGVALTPEGLRLFEAVRQGLDAIDAAAAEIRAARRGARRTCNVATDFGFAAYWLLPRLASLRAIMPERDVRIVTSQDEVDVRAEPVDVAIVFGPAQRLPGCTVSPLFPEIVVPVCSPALLSGRAAAIERADDLRSLPLLHLESAAPGRWLTWADWFAAQRVSGATADRGLTFNTYPFVIQAAVAGQGVALGWVPLIDELVRTGQLVALDLPVRTERGYAIVEPQRKRTERANALFRDWLLKRRLDRDTGREPRPRS